MSDNHEMRQGSLIKICRILLWRIQNPTKTPGICEFEVMVLNVTVGMVNDNKFASTKFHCPPILFRLEAKVCETLVL